VADPSRWCLAIGVALALPFGCAAPPPASSGAVTGGAANLGVEAGFVELAPRDVVVQGRGVSLASTSKIFYNFRPADSEPGTRPLLVLFNGFASDVVRAFGTGPNSVAPDGTIAPNPDSLTHDANLLYIDPRQAGFSYDVLVGRAPRDSDCSQDVFSEYVDAADVLLAVLQFVQQHAALKGPVFWLGESYAGVRITWILAYLRQAWALSPYQDDHLKSMLAQTERARYLSGQVLLQPWLAGAAHAAAIREVCQSPGLLAAVQSSVSVACADSDACACARSNGRSPYNYTLTTAEEDARLFLADAAQVAPEAAEALYGVRFETIIGLHGSERARGFKCSVADDQTPDQTALGELLGALPAGQSYNLAYSPLTTGKGSVNPDWRAQNLVGVAFLDNAKEVPTFVSDGQRDLVVPEAALVPALRAVSAPLAVSESRAAISIEYPSGTRQLSVRHYPNAGHMITMMEPAMFAADLRDWLATIAP